MAVTMTASQRWQPISRDGRLWHLLVKAEGTGDGSGGAVTVNTYLYGLQSRDFVIFDGAQIVQNAADNIASHVAVFDADWSCLQAGTSRVGIYLVGDKTWRTNQAPAYVIDYALSMNRPVILGEPMKDASYPDPTLAIAFDTNTNTKIYRVWVRFHVTRPLR